ncbi:MAG TPA: sigma-70 family RNA polymerase sigma factor [Acidimicrobiales bacterium]|nr:sigma-70 family RNA polymerase sigma factor [Acidimicrobiales bacterium]
MRGDSELFEELYPGLRRFAAATAPREVDPDDLVQEAVARTLRQHSLTELDDAGAYLRRAIANLASNHRRGFARWRVAIGRVGRTEEGRMAEYDSDLADLLRVPPEGRAVLYLVDIEGRPYAEAATLLGISEEAARARAARARRRLRLDLEGEQS